MCLPHPDVWVWWLPYFGKWAHELTLLWPVWSENKNTKLLSIWNYSYKKQKRPHTATPPTVVLSVSVRYSRDILYICVYGHREKSDSPAFLKTGTLPGPQCASCQLLPSDLLSNIKITKHETSCYEELIDCICLISSEQLLQITGPGFFHLLYINVM